MKKTKPKTTIVVRQTLGQATPTSPSTRRQVALVRIAMIRTLASKADKFVASIACQARTAATQRGSSLVEEFHRRVKHLPNAPIAPSVVDQPPPFGPKLGELERGRSLQIQSLRAKLETALLRLETSGARDKEAHGPWPTRRDYETLDSIVAELGAAIATNVPSTPWKLCTKIDLYFARLKLQARVKAFVHRACASIPDRPLSVFLSLPETIAPSLAKEFFENYSATRRGTDPIAFPWDKYESLLIHYKTSKIGGGGWHSSSLCRSSKLSKSMAYLTFLELERSDLRWMIFHGDATCALMDWLEHLGNDDLLDLMKPFDAGPLCLVDRYRAQHLRNQIAFQRRGAALRKARSRKNSSQQMGQSAARPSDLVARSPQQP